MSQLTPRVPAAPRPKLRPAEVGILRTLRKICANLRALQRSPHLIRSYRNVEQRLSALERQLSSRFAPRVRPAGRAAVRRKS